MGGIHRLARRHFSNRENGPVQGRLAARPAQGVCLFICLFMAFVAATPARGEDSAIEFLQGSLSELIAQASGTSPGYSGARHEAAEGPRLVADQAREHASSNFGPARCPAAAQVKFYDIAAVATLIYMNRYGDNDPDGFLYTGVENVEEIRRLANAGAREHFGVSLGQGADIVQPMTMRINVGDCLRVRLLNRLEGATSFHVHGADLIVTETGDPALTTNPDAMALPGETVVYEWFVDPEYYAENTHYAHPHGPAGRFQVSHGLFAGVIVEPLGSDYLDPRTGDNLCADPREDGVRKCRNSWDAVISPGDGEDFREFAMFYHEVGNENYNARDAQGRELPAIEPVTVTYKPSGRAINYRSEPFSNRLIDQDAAHPEFYGQWQPDVALAYSSYAFGEPPTPVPQSYLGDPVKFRLLHAGSETFHVPHLHGGGVQWQRQPKIGQDAENYVPLNAGLMKQFAASMPSSATDSQSLGPSETFDLEIGCGSGGCQQSVGDFLFHCHIASHYIAGMWNYWRVYNTLQDADGKTDELGRVIELPDRRGRMEPAVTSEELIGRTVEFSGRTVEIVEAALAELVETQLPPQGKRRDVQDAQVFDWTREGNLYLNEPETDRVWVNFSSPAPGERFAIMFSSDTGRLAWPFLRPHLGLRPPFAPHHGPAPFLEPVGHTAHEPAPPGANGPASVCPEGAPVRAFKIHAIQLEIQVARRETLRTGMLYVLKEDEARIRGDQSLKIPLAIRANQGDCIDIVLVNEITGLRSRTRPLPNVDKANIHTHFLQFDIQGSDGVPTGAAFEQAVRPLEKGTVATPLRSGVAAGTQRITVEKPQIFHPGALVAIGLDQVLEKFETVRIAEIDGADLVLAEPLRKDHGPGELVSAEFVRYRWYVARQNGAVYFHDHIDALRRWGRGLFGALIAEPKGATFHDPRTGEEITSGTVADIHVEGETVPGLAGSFREFVLFLTDRTPDVRSTINLRAEPLVQNSTALRSSSPRRGLTSRIFSSEAHGEPFTPIFEAYVGDPIMMRVLATATEDIHPLVVTGHQFRRERFHADSPLTNVINIDISERFNAYIEAAGGPTGRPGDYIYYNGVQRHFENGAWGFLRVLGGRTEDLRPLPGHELPAEPGPQLAEGEPGNPCPADAPLRQYGVSVVPVTITVNIGRGQGSQIVGGRRYVLDDPSGGTGTHLDKTLDPLVLRVNDGDCLEVALTNKTTNFASLNIEGANFDPAGSYGGQIGRNRDSTVETGETKLYRFYLGSELGAMRIRDYASPFVNLERDLYGALIVEPKGATYHDPLTDRPIDSGVAAVIRLPDGSYFREFVTAFMDQDHRIGRFVMPYFEQVQGEVAVNYRAAPLHARFKRLGDETDPRQAHLFDEVMHGPPATAVFTAEAGDKIRFRVISADSEQPPVFSVEGHDWLLTPGVAGSDVVSSRLLAASGAIDVHLRQGGGAAGRPGDYLWSNHRLPYMEAGQWGILRILARKEQAALGPRRDVELFTQLRL